MLHDERMTVVAVRIVLRTMLVEPGARAIRAGMKQPNRAAIVDEEVESHFLGHRSIGVWFEPVAHRILEAAGHIAQTTSKNVGQELVSAAGAEH